MSSAENIMIATDMNDNVEFSNIKNVAQFWGNSIFTRGFCHGFECARNKAGLYVTSEMFLKFIVHIVYIWNKSLTIFGNKTVIDQISEKDEFKKRGVNALSNSAIAEFVGDETQIKFEQNCRLCGKERSWSHIFLLLSCTLHTTETTFKCFRQTGLDWGITTPTNCEMCQKLSTAVDMSFVMQIFQKSAHGFSRNSEERGIDSMQRRAETGKDGQKRSKAFYCLAAKGIPEREPGALRTGEDRSAYIKVAIGCFCRC